MTKLIKTKPAPYPSNNSEELNSVIKLLDLLDKRYIKPDPKLLDKIPNIDGHITVVDREQRPVGKFEVQIKTLPDNKIDKPAYQCDSQFLSYCEQSQLPVILIVVNATHEKAFWLHMDRELIKKLAGKIKKRSVAVHLSNTKLISRVDSKYITDWTTIVEDAKKIYSEFEELKKDLRRLERLNKKLSINPKPRHTISEDDIKKAFLFLDTLNYTLSNDFKIVKDTFFRDYRALGLAFSKFKKELVYTMYPIKYGVNDLMLKEVKNLSGLMKSGETLGSLTYSAHNAIKEDPQAFAYKFIAKETQRMLKKRFIKILSDELCTEYILDFVEFTADIFCLNKEIIDVIDLKKRICGFLPFWCEEYRTYRRLPSNTFFEFEPESFLLELTKVAKKKIYENAISRYERDEPSSLEIHFISGAIDYDYLFKAIDTRIANGIKTIKRPYPVKRNVIKIENIYKAYRCAEAFQKVEFIFKSLPLVYDEFIRAFFPNLSKKLAFFSDTDLLIVNFVYKVKENDMPQPPGIDLYELKASEEYNGERIMLYVNSKGCPLQIRKIYDFYKTGLYINNMEFTVKSCQSRRFSNIYRSFTLQELLYDTLKRRFEEYFEILSAAGGTQ